MRASLIITVFTLGLSCGTLLSARIDSPSSALAQDRSSRKIPSLQSGGDLAPRVAALEAKIQRIEGSIRVSSTGAVTIQGPKLDVASSAFEVDAAIARFGNTVQAKTLNVTNVIAASYTPGAGNIW